MGYFTEGIMRKWLSISIISHGVLGHGNKNVYDLGNNLEQSDNNLLSHIDFKISKMKRFAQPLDSEKLDEAISKTISDNSKRKAQWAVNIFRTWLKDRQSNGLIQGLHVFKDIENMSQSELDSQLKYFVFEVRKVNGERYPANTLRDIFQGIGFYINQIIGKPFKLFSDSEFAESRRSLDAAMKTANKDGIVAAGNGPASPILPDQENILWEKNL